MQNFSLENHHMMNAKKVHIFVFSYLDFGPDLSRWLVVHVYM